MADYTGCYLKVGFLQSEVIPDESGLDVRKSIRTYAAGLREKLMKQYPGAEVAVYCSETDDLPAGFKAGVEGPAKVKPLVGELDAAAQKVRSELKNWQVKR